MRLVLLAAAALSVSAGAAFASEQATTSPVRGARVVTMCDRAEDARTSWIRDCASRSSSPEARLTAVAAERPTRQVFLCNRSAETRSSWMREYGSITFVTAEELAAAEASNEGWATPRCMTSSQMQKYVKGRPEELTVARALNAAPGL
jgi:hypothetical protein